MSDAARFAVKYGPWAVVTGASEGIGRSVALSIAERGVNVVLVARRLELLTRLSEELARRFGVQVRILPLDLAKPEALAALVEATRDLEVGLFAAIAGFGTSGPFIHSRLPAELDMIDVNCRAVVAQTHHFANRFAARRRGGIILMGSLVGFQGVPGAANYAATKAFIQTFAEGLHGELKPCGVDVLSAAPGPVESGFGRRADMVMSKAATPEEVGPAMVAALGRKVTVRPGFLAKLLGWSLAALPRRYRVGIMGSIMGQMTRHQRKAA